MFHNKAASRETGSSIVAVVLVVVTLAVLSMTAFNSTMTLARNVERTNSYREAMNVADGALELAFAHWREISRQRSNINRPGSAFSGLALPTASMFDRIPNFTASTGPNPGSGQPFTIANFKIAAVDPQFNLVDQNVAPPAATGMSIGTRSTYYLATADVTLPTMTGNVQAKMRRVFEKQILSPWNYAIFYVDDLEIHPGPPFVVTGWVHSNGKVYTGHDTLTFGSKMTYGDDWVIGFMPGEASHNGETPTPPHYPDNRPPTREQGQQPYGLDSTRVFSTTDTNPNNDSYREIVERRTGAGADPFTDLTDPTQPHEARYYDQADIRILVGAGGALTIRNGSDQLVTASSTGTNKLIYDLVTSAVTSGQTIQDNREAAQVRLTTLDVAKVNAALQPGGPMATASFNGVIYISDTTSASAPSNERRGIRLKNGAAIPPGGLTVASDNAVYIQGDYNTGTTATSLPPSNLPGAANDPSKPTVSTYQRQSCAVIADAVMVLSNAWNDATSSSGVGSRIATNTTVNTAIVSGIVVSGTNGNNYSGGAENFPRFLETWGSSTTLTYYGSMVQLYKSKYHTGVWGKSNVYVPPKRNWFFDTRFYTDPPPGTLDLVLYKKGRWYLE
jgi:hypothetical protein